MFINWKYGETTMIPFDGTDCFALVEDYAINGHFVKFLWRGETRQARIIQSNDTKTNNSNNKILIWEGGGSFDGLRVNFRLETYWQNKTTTFCDAVMLPCTGDSAAEHPLPVLNDPAYVCGSAISTIAKLKQNRWTWPMASAREPNKLNMYLCWMRLQSSGRW